MKQIVTGIKQFIAEEDGVAMVEYGLVAALIAVVAVTAVTNVGTHVTSTFATICQKLNSGVVC